MSDESSNGQQTEVWDDFAPSREFKIKNRADGQTRTFVASESSGGEDYWKWFEAWADATMDRNKYPDGEKGDEEFARAMLRKGVQIKELQLDLICQCVTHEGRQVERSVAAAWGNRTRVMAFDLCQDVNGNSRGAAEAAGKDSGDVESSTGSTTSPAA